MLFIHYPKCTTCQKAKKWLDSHNIPYTERHIKEENPTLEELTQWYKASGLPLKKFFNTSGMLYREMGLKDKLADGVVVLASEKEGKVNLIAMATDSAQKAGAHAGNLIKAIAAKVGGGGGGRPNMAQAGGKNPAGIPDAIEEAKSALEGMLK